MTRRLSGLDRPGVLGLKQARGWEGERFRLQRWAARATRVKYWPASRSLASTQGPTCSVWHFAVMRRTASPILIGWDRFNPPHCQAQRLIRSLTVVSDYIWLPGKWPVSSKVGFCEFPASRKFPYDEWYIKMTPLSSNWLSHHFDFLDLVIYLTLSLWN